MHVRVYLFECAGVYGTQSHHTGVNEALFHLIIQLK